MYIREKLPLDLRVALEGETKRQRDNETSDGESVSSSHRLIVSPSINTPVVDLTLKLLGHVEIYRDPTKHFAPDAWTTRRARDIFCFIASSRHRRVEKDVVIDTFWAESELEVVEKNFHPTISHIRKALNSRQTFKQNFLVFRDGAYQLNPELSYSIDTEDFENQILEAEKAKRENDAEHLRASLEAAHNLYRGEFMAGVYDDWAEERRAYYSEQNLRVLKSGGGDSSRFRIICRRQSQGNDAADSKSLRPGGAF